MLGKIFIIDLSVLVTPWDADDVFRIRLGHLLGLKPLLVCLFQLTASPTLNPPLEQYEFCRGTCRPSATWVCAYLFVWIHRV